MVPYNSLVFRVLLKLENCYSCYVPTSYYQHHFWCKHSLFWHFRLQATYAETEAGNLKMYKKENSTNCMSKRQKLTQIQFNVFPDKFIVYTFPILTW